MNTKAKYWASITAGILSLAGYASAASLGSEKYTYDSSGNIIEKFIDGQVTKMSYDASNKVTSIASSANGSELITYDAAGRPLSYKKASDHYTRQASYGYEDKVLKADGASGKAELFYNAEGQLVAKTVAGEVTSYIWDDNVMAAEGTETFLNENHISGGIPVMSGNQDVVVSDYLGNTLSQGKSQFKSTAYGEGLEQGRFTGKSFVQELGSYVFHHRLYSPETLRWNTKDPIGFPDGINNLLYVVGDPLSRLDPLGTDVADMSQQVEATGGECVQVRYSYRYGKYQKPEYLTGSASIPSSTNSAGWSDPKATVDCSETIPRSYPGTNNKLYWKNEQDINDNDTIKGTASAKYNGIWCDSIEAFDSPPFEK